MTSKFTQLLYWLQQILEAIQCFTEHMKQQVSPPATLPEKLWLKEEVIQYLRISERGSDRFKQRGILKVMRLGSRDYITPEALMAALQESIRKGNI